MDTLHCNRCGEEYSTTYRRCPFCQEAAAERRGRPMYRRGKRLDTKQRSAGAFGVLKLVTLVIVLLTALTVVFGDDVAQFLGIRTQQPNIQQDDPPNTPPVTGQDDNGDNTPDTSDTPDTPDTSDPPVVPDGGGETVPPEVTPLALDQTAITIPAGETARITATGGSGEIIWSSSNNEIATVDGGSVTGVAGGTVTITATTGEESVSCTVTVTGDPWVNPVTLSLNRTDFTLLPSDKSFQLKVKGTDSPVTWSSSNENVATVSSTGVVTRVGKGTATITAQVDGQTLTCIVRVS